MNENENNNLNPEEQTEDTQAVQVEKEPTEDKAPVDADYEVVDKKDDNDDEDESFLSWLGRSVAPFIYIGIGVLCTLFVLWCMKMGDDTPTHLTKEVAVATMEKEFTEWQMREINEAIDKNRYDLEMNWGIAQNHVHVKLHVKTYVCPTCGTKSSNTYAEQELDIAFAYYCGEWHILSHTYTYIEPEE